MIKIMDTETCNDILAYNNLLIQENTNLIIKKKMKIVEIEEKQRIIDIKGLIYFLIYLIPIINIEIQLETLKKELQN